MTGGREVIILHIIRDVVFIAFVLAAVALLILGFVYSFLRWCVLRVLMRIGKMNI